MDFDGIFVNEKLYWDLDQADFRPLVSFDLATETFGKVDQPNVYNSFTILGALEGNLCLICENFHSYSCEVWVMEENCDSRASWNKK